MQRSPRVSTLLVALVTALALAGVAGTAHSADLTTKAVRKIAAKVVKQKAKKLTVAEARNAQRLQGATAAQLRTREYRYTLPVTTGDSVLVHKFPGLPTGQYVASYSFVASTSVSGARVTCELLDGLSNPSTAIASNAIPGESTTFLSASTGLSVTTDDVRLVCSTLSGDVAVSGSNQSTVSFLAVDTVVPGVATVP
jgi:hypothetical protein